MSEKNPDYILNIFSHHLTCNEAIKLDLLREVNYKSDLI